LENADISVGDIVEVTSQEGKIIINKVEKRKFDLAEMVSHMPRSYRVWEEPFGKSLGREEW